MYVYMYKCMHTHSRVYMFSSKKFIVFDQFVDCNNTSIFFLFLNLLTEVFCELCPELFFQ